MSISTSKRRSKRVSVGRDTGTVAPGGADRARIIRRVASWAGGERQAVAWYEAEPIPAFGGRTAMQAVDDGKAVAVELYLDQVVAGGFA